MRKAQSFRDLVVWQKARSLVKLVYRLTRLLPREERYGLGSQMQRAAVSVPSNIAEGWARGSKPEFRNRCLIALGSLHELETLTDLAEDLEYLTAQQTLDSRCLMDEVGRILTTLRKRLRPLAPNS